MIINIMKKIDKKIIKKKKEKEKSIKIMVQHKVKVNSQI